MVFWRKKKNIKEHEQDEHDEKLLHPANEPEIEPSTEYDAEMDENTKHELEETEIEIIEDLEDSPVPDHTVVEDAKEAEELEDDHSSEGGWLSRLTSGLRKSSNKISTGISDLLTKKKLDQDTLDALEEVLISADLGPKTAMGIIENFSKDRFGKDIDDNEIKEALAGLMSDILEPVVKEFVIERPESGPFVVLVCGVNGAGKTTTIGKMSNKIVNSDCMSVLIAAGDTFRAAAVEQLQVWSERVKCGFYAKDIGDDAASVAYEAYNKAAADGTDVLLIDTAGRLQNKSNLMDELQKIIRVLKKQDENLPHAVLLVLDATTGQNAFSQVETFKEMVDVTGLIVTKLDGSAKGGVLIGLADQFGVPVHAIGVGESIEDLQSFKADQYAKSLMGIDA